MRFTAHHWVVVVLTALAAALRLVNVNAFSLSHDELITLQRLLFDDFLTVVRQGVMTDTHPAGVHLFLWVWSKLGGMGDAWLRVPFIAMGIACVPLMYRAALLWTNKPTALLATAFMAAAQFPVYYSQLARPYIPGLFFMLLAIPPFFRLTQGTSKGWRDVVLLGFSLAAMAYTQHLAMVHAAVLAACGLFWTKAEGRKNYLMALGLALVLYAPHLPVTLHQIQRGGVGGPDGWLGAPGWNWPNEFLAYLTHFIPGALLVVVVLLGLNRPWESKSWLRAALLAVLPLALAFFYSRWVNPLLQYSGLLFGLPFWLMLLLYRRKEDRFWTLAEPALLSLILVVTLVRDRQHYALFNNLGYKTYAHLLEQHPEALGLHRDAPMCVAHYTDARNYAAGMPNDAVSQDSLRRFLRKTRATSLLVGNARPDHLAVLREFYPAELRLDAGFTHETRLFEAAGQPWSRAVLHRVGPQTFAADEEFMAVKRIPLDSLDFLPWNRIGVAALGQASDVIGYLAIKEGEKVVWKHVNFAQEGAFTYMVSDLLTDHPQPFEAGAVLEVGLLHTPGRVAQTDSLYVWMEEGNQMQYALLAPIPHR